MKAKELVFNWIKTGEQYENSTFTVNCCGHNARIHMSYTRTWTCIIDNKIRENGIRTEQAAKEYAEMMIKCKISKRIDKALRELEILTGFSA